MFSKKHYFLNYGEGGYGVDQIFLLFQKSIEHFDNPFVVLSIMTDDVRRSMNQVRGGPKPYFQIEQDTLKLCGVPLHPDPEVFYTSNPPKIKSYLYQLLIRKIPSYRIREFFKTGNPKVLINPTIRYDDMKRLNKKIILEIINKLNENKIKYVFLIFHSLEDLTLEKEWIDEFLTQIFIENDVPYISSKELIKRDAFLKNKKYIDYYQPNNMPAHKRHPSIYQNRIIVEEIKKYVLGKR